MTLRRVPTLCAAGSAHRSIVTQQLVGRTDSRLHDPSRRCLNTTRPSPATPLPVTAHGPPPAPPTPAAAQHGDRFSRRRRQAEVLRQVQAMRAPLAKSGGALKARFWKDVTVRRTPDGFHIMLDARPVRTPSKSTLAIPLSKPHLASAIALEWDLLVSAQQALKHHLIPLTSLVSRAQDIEAQDDGRPGRDRDEIVDMVMRYLDTDTLLCWAPETSSPRPMEQPTAAEEKKSLRNIQQRVALPIISYLTTVVWPGAEIHPVTDAKSIVPPPQPQLTKDIIRGWIAGLPAWELAGLERAVLAGKGLLGATRLLVEWSPQLRHLRDQTRSRFGIEEAARAASLELQWQTGIWGEVEDTHDVEKEDLRRQLGAVILLVSDDERWHAHGGI
ncbi:MAG: ATP synthase complex assembly protein atp12 [Piccolia ochrophora]|nr:MAG: ATP synthase complex assembly protein atp12 [Piccolia ochrophora]